MYLYVINSECYLHTIPFIILEKKLFSTVQGSVHAVPLDSLHTSSHNFHEPKSLISSRTSLIFIGCLETQEQQTVVKSS